MQTETVHGFPPAYKAHSNRTDSAIGTRRLEDFETFKNTFHRPVIPTRHRSRRLWGEQERKTAKRERGPLRDSNPGPRTESLEDWESIFPLKELLALGIEHRTLWIEVKHLQARIIPLDQAAFFG